jgi:DNA repair photolyase
MRPADDSRHALLSKARPLSQLVLDRLDGPGRDRYGGRGVQEVEVKSALNDVDMGGPCWSLNPYTGCLHDCVYCYVPDTMHAERQRWGSYAIVKRNLPSVLQDELRRKPRRKVYIGTSTDAYQPVERDHLITQRCLEVLARHDWPVRLLTRSPLVLRDIPLLRRIDDLSVGLSVPTLDDKARALLEPGAPTIQVRLDALRKLADAGLRTFVNYAPAYPLTSGVRPTDIAEAFREAGVRWVYTQPWGYLRNVLPALRKRLQEAAAASLAIDGLDELYGRVEDEAMQQRLLQTLKVAFEKAGLEVWIGDLTPKKGVRPTPSEGRFRVGTRDGPTPARPAVPDARARAGSPLLPRLQVLPSE